MTWQKPFITKADRIESLFLRSIYAQVEHLLDAMYYRFVKTNGDKLFRLHWFYG